MKKKETKLEDEKKRSTTEEEEKVEEIIGTKAEEKETHPEIECCNEAEYLDEWDAAVHASPVAEKK